MKKCPYCAEEIQDEAIKCRYCGEYLKKRWWRSCLLNCLIGLFVTFIFSILFTYLGFVLLKFILYKLFFGGQNPSAQYHAPFSPPAIQDILQGLGEGFKAFWQGLKSFFQGGYHNFRV